MKRITAICAALLAAVLLTACMPQDGAALSDAAQPPRAEDTRSALPFAVGRLYDLSWATINPLTGCSDETAFYSLRQLFLTEEEPGERQISWLIMRIDFETRTQAPLCSLPGCAHEGTECPAYLCGVPGKDEFALATVEGRLYVLHTALAQAVGAAGSAETSLTVWLDAAAADGSGRRRVAELPAGWVLSKSFPATDGAALYGQYLDLNDDSVRGVRIALATGEVVSFPFGLDDSEELLGVCGDQFILRRSDEAILQIAYPGVIAPEWNSLLLSEYGSYSPSSLLLYDPTAGMRTRLNNGLAQAGLSSMPYYVLAQQGKLYYITTDDFTVPQIVWQIDLAADTARVLAEFPAPSIGGWRSLEALQLCPAGPDTLEPYVLGSWWDGQSNVFLLDVRDGSVLEIGLRYKDSSGESRCSRPVAQTDSGLWLVPVDCIFSSDPWWIEQYFFALAAPETVVSGEGDLFPIQMWDSPQPLG